jgi:hypothetical protein
VGSIEQPQDPFLGRVLSGRYEILAPLGVGGMGRVYRAVQRPLDRLVALKVLDPQYDRASDPEFEKRFLREASATARLRHQNTIRVHDYGRTDDGIYFIAMELVEGETLRQVLLKSGPLPWPRALIIGAQIARSLREAHKLGLVHRDLKPANIMLLPGEDGDEAVKVLDFGLAKDFTLRSDGGNKPGELTQARMLLGSPLFMSPEHIRNQADPRSDIYSLGIVLFLAISGRTPFTGSDPIEIMVKHLHDKPPQLNDVVAVPAEVNHLVMKCLEKARAARFQTMDDLLEALGRATTGLGLSGVFKEGASGIALGCGGSFAPLAEAAHLAASEAPTPRRSGLFRGTLPLIAGAALTLALVATAAWTFIRVEPPEEQAASAPPPVTAAAAPMPEYSPPPEAVFEITSEPPGAAVLLGERTVGITPFNLALPLERGEQGDAAPLELEFSLEGYFSAIRVVQGGESHPVPVHQVLVRRLAPTLVAGPEPRPAPPPILPKDPRSAPKEPTYPIGYKDDPYQ